MLISMWNVLVKLRNGPKSGFRANRTTLTWFAQRPHWVALARFESDRASQFPDEGRSAGTSNGFLYAGETVASSRILWNYHTFLLTEP